MDNYECNSCGYVHSFAKDKTSKDHFELTPKDWVCPACQAEKSDFKKLGPEYQAHKLKLNEKLQKTKTT